MEENLTNEQLDVQENTNQQYIDAIANLKANSVSKERYNKLVEENKNLLNSLVNGESVTAVTPIVEKPSLEEIMKSQREYAKKKDQIGFVQKSLEFRERLLEETGEDCFVAKGLNVTPTADSYMNAQKVADIYKECIDYANGDNEAFINEVQRRMVESPLANIKNNNKNYRR